jgi:hypothetical protein
MKLPEQPSFELPKGLAAEAAAYGTAYGAYGPPRKAGEYQSVSAAYGPTVLQNTPHKNRTKLPGVTTASSRVGRKR